MANSKIIHNFFTYKLINPIIHTNKFLSQLRKHYCEIKKKNIRVKVNHTHNVG